MALYQTQKASLNGIKGSGYVFPRKTFSGKQYQGVFFSDDGEDLESALESEQVMFTGVIYERTKEKFETIPVDVQNIESVHIGQRADFEVLDA